MAWDSIGSLPSVSVRAMNFSSSSWKSNQTENGNAHLKNAENLVFGDHSRDSIHEAWGDKFWVSIYLFKLNHLLFRQTTLNLLFKKNYL